MGTTIAITTPTGKIGSQVTQRLLEAAENKDIQLVLLARHPETMQHFVARGARVEQGSLDDPEFVVRATRDADTLFWLTPQNLSTSVDIRSDYLRYGLAALEKSHSVAPCF